MVTNGANKYIRESERIRQYRGLYSRVAKEVGVDRSFVSRVANGDRSSEAVEKALAREIERIEKAHASKPQRSSAVAGAKNPRNGKSKQASKSSAYKGKRG